MKTKIISSIDRAMLRRGFNTATFFIKPHAAKNGSVIKFIDQFLLKHGITVRQTKTIKSNEIKESGLIDKHYLLNSTAANVLPIEQKITDQTRIEVREKFNLNWDEGVQSEKIINAKQAKDLFKLNPGELNRLWEENSSMKISSTGFYMAKMMIKGQEKYVINGFYPSLKEKYTADDAEIRLYVVSFPNMDWSKFRELIGKTNPEEALKELATGIESIRGILAKEASEYGLEMTYQDNAVHASASPLEAMYEGMWTNTDNSKDPLGSILKRLGLSDKALCTWINNPVVEFEGKEDRVFNHLELKNTNEAAAILFEMYVMETAKRYIESDIIDADDFLEQGDLVKISILSFLERLQNSEELVLSLNHILKNNN